MLELVIAVAVSSIWTLFGVWMGFWMGRQTRESDLKRYMMPDDKPVKQGAPLFDEDPWDEAMQPPTKRIPTMPEDER